MIAWFYFAKPMDESAEPGSSSDCVNDYLAWKPRSSDLVDCAAAFGIIRPIYSRPSDVRESHRTLASVGRAASDWRRCRLFPTGIVGLCARATSYGAVSS